MAHSMYGTYREYVHGMQDAFNSGDKKLALEYENKIRNYIGCFDHEGVLDEIQFEMHNTKETQTSWPYRKKKSKNATIKPNESDEED